MAVVTPTYHPNSVRNRRVIEVFGGIFVFSLFFLEFSVGVRAFVLGLSQTSSELIQFLLSAGRNSISVQLHI